MHVDGEAAGIVIRLVEAEPAGEEAACLEFALQLLQGRRLAVAGRPLQQHGAAAIVTKDAFQNRRAADRPGVPGRRKQLVRVDLRLGPDAAATGAFADAHPVPLLVFF